MATEEHTILDERREQLARSWFKFSRSSISVIGALMILSVIFVAIFAPIVAPYPGDVQEVNLDRQSIEPNTDHLMGTDNLGRDIFSRVIFGSRLALMMIVSVLSIAIGLGTVLGLIAGYSDGIASTVIMRTADIFLSVPPLVLALAIVAAVGGGMLYAMIAISLAWWPWYTRLVYGEVLSVKEEEFVEASESIGSGWVRTVFKEILPNVIAPITVKGTLDMGNVILIGAAISFLGLGASPPTPDWGTMIAFGRDYVTLYWWMAVMPGLAISYTVLGFNLLGDGLRDVLDVDEVQQP